MLMLMEASLVFSLNLLILFPARLPTLFFSKKTLHCKPTGTSKSFFYLQIFFFRGLKKATSKRKLPNAKPVRL